MANQAWQITSPGNMSLVDLNTPIPKAGSTQAFVHIYAVAFNFRDIMVVDHSPNYPITHKANLIPCTDGAGIVEEAGEASIWKKGDRVIVHPSSWLHGSDPRNFKLSDVSGAGEVDGTLRRWMVCDDDRLIKAPEGLSMEEASTMSIAGVTAYYSLFHGPIRLERGMTVLTQGTGGVSCYAIQIAAAAGATVIATSSSDEKLAIAKDLGAKHLINYRKTPDWNVEVLKFTNGAGVDIVVDVVGAESIEQSVKATRYGGAIMLLGLLSEDPTKKVNIMLDLFQGAKVLQAHMGAGNKDVADETSSFMEKYQLHPRIAKVFGFEEADKALEAMKKLSAPGKIVVKV